MWLDLVQFVLANLTLAGANDLATAGTGVALFGLDVEFSQGLVAAMVADAATVDVRGTAFQRGTAPALSRRGRRVRVIVVAGARNHLDLMTRGYAFGLP